MPRRNVIACRVTAAERQVLDMICARTGATNRSEAMRYLLQSGARAYGLDKPRRRLRRLELPADPPKAA